MKEILTDILIVGGGLTGLLAALSLSTNDNQIVLIDRYDFANLSKENTDLRTTAISEGSKNFFEKIKIWQKINKHSEKIKYIDVFDRNKSSKINFYNNKKQNYLGYVIKNTILKSEIIKVLKTKKNIKLIKKDKLKKIQYNENKIEILTNQYKIKPSILLAADGKNSSVRNIVKTNQFKKNYNHSAIVTNFSHTQNHNNTAYEIFYKTGPLAILPMKSSSKSLFSSSLIWSNEKNYVDSFINTTPDIQIKILQEKIFDYVGDIKEVYNVKVFNLSAHLNSKFYEPRLVYLGDAAHSMHPIAGQGWNLGVRDVKNISNVICNAQKLGLDLGTQAVCKQYHDLSFNDAYTLFQVTDKLNSIFLNNNLIFRNLRQTGFDLINKNLNIKKIISNYAMGV